MSPDLSNMIVAVDFDGTIVEHRYPDIGAECPGAVETLKWLNECGAKVILWTMRSGEQLVQATAWLINRGVLINGLNKNPDQASWTDSPKAYAHIYIDDAALGCPTKMDSEGVRECVDWERVRPQLEAKLQDNMVLRVTTDELVELSLSVINDCAVCNGTGKLPTVDDPGTAQCWKCLGIPAEQIDAEVQTCPRN